MKRIMRAIINSAIRIANWAMTEKTEGSIYQQPGSGAAPQAGEEIHSVWDYLSPAENSQAFHLAGVLGYEEWIDMEEIKRRTREIYRAEYKNERSLYPYIKSLTDVGLFEHTSAGGRRKWRKRDIIIKLAAGGDETQETQKAVKKIAGRGGEADIKPRP